MKKLLVAALMLAVAFGGLAQRTGAWVDEVVFFEEPSHPKGVEMVRTGAADVYTFGISAPALVRTIVENVGYEKAYGLFVEISFNPFGPRYRDGRLNPFSVPRVREAMNWLTDRDFLVAEFYGGVAGMPRFFPITPTFPDYAKLADVARRLELEYAYDFERGKAVIAEEMVKLGATLVGGKWHDGGQPVIVKVLIRPEDERLQIGDYVADQLERIGFTTVRDYKRAAEASPIWFAGDPALGLFDVYTGGWITTVVDRDQADNWDFFYTKRGLPGRPLWEAYTPDPVHDKLWEDLSMNRFATEEERLEMMGRALEYGMKDSVRIFVTNRVGHFARNKDISVAADLAGGISGAWLWSRTLRWRDRVGGTVLMGQTSMLTEPWNPLGGSNWIFDQMIIRGTTDYATLPDPFTGLPWPQNVARAEVFVLKGVPSLLTLREGVDFGGGLRGWITQTFMDEIVVPGDAWADWDAKTQTFITADQRFGGRTTARSMVRVTYPASVFDRLWHDGSKMTVGDMILAFIIGFDRAKEESAIYDAAVVPAFRTFMGHFKGLRIVRTSPDVVFEVYSDSVFLEAELTAAARAAFLWPTFAFGPGPWHTLTLGIQAEAAGRLAFSTGQARARGVEQTSYIAGPSLVILNEYLSANAGTGFFPYAPTLGRFITAAEANARWANLAKWSADRGHLFVSNGPLFVDSVRTVEKVVVTRRFPGFTDPAGKWAVFGEPKLAEVAVTGRPTIRAGEATDITVNIMFRDEPYPLVQLDFVRFLLFDGVGNIVATGEGTPVRDGQYVIRLTADQTRGLVGACKVEVVVASKVVAIPTFASFSFVVTR